MTEPQKTVKLVPAANTTTSPVVKHPEKAKIKSADFASSVSYVKDVKLEKRRISSYRTRSKHANCVPVIVAKDPSSTGTPEIPVGKNKFLVPFGDTVSDIILGIRKQVALGPEQSISIFFNNNDMVAPGTLMSQIDKQYRSDDGFVYVIYSLENTFG